MNLYYVLLVTLMFRFLGCFGCNADIVANADNRVTFQLSTDGGDTFNDMMTSIEWGVSLRTSVNNINPNTIFRFKARDIGASAGFISTVTLMDTNNNVRRTFFTDNPLTKFDVVSSTDDNLQISQYVAFGSGPWSTKVNSQTVPDMNTNAYWIWNSNLGNTMYFEINFVNYKNLLNNLGCTLSPTMNPTSVPTIMVATLSPKESNVTSQLDETGDKTLDCDVNVQLMNQTNQETLTNLYDLYYSNRTNVTGWMMILSMNETVLKYIYPVNSNSNDSVFLFDEVSVWYLVNNDTGIIEKNNSIKLYLECKDEESVDSEAEIIVEYTTYTVVAILLLIAIMLILIAFCYHSKKKGSDYPSYISILKCSMEISDLFTDISFVFTLYLNEYATYWYLIPMILIIVPYLLSICVALYKINFYKRYRSYNEPQQHVIGYMNDFDKQWLILTVTVGFYATFKLFTSHLFHLRITSLQIPKIEKYNIKTLRIINVVLIENLGMFILQIVYLNQFGGLSENNKMDSQTKLTVLSMIFSVISIISGLLTILSRLIHFCFMKKMGNIMMSECYFYLDINGEEIQNKHIHSHHLIQSAVSKAISSDVSAVETIVICRTSKGINCKMRVCISDDNQKQNYAKLFTIITNDTHDGLKTALKANLKVSKLQNISTKQIKNRSNAANIEIHQTLQRKTNKN